MAKKGHQRIPGGFPQGGRGGPGMPSPQQLARQMAEMRAKIDEQRAALAEATFPGTAGGGIGRPRRRRPGGAAALMFEPPTQRLIDELARLPGIGRKSAQRLAFHLLVVEEADAIRLGNTIVELRRLARL